MFSYFFHHRKCSTLVKPRNFEMEQGENHIPNKVPKVWPVTHSHLPTNICHSCFGSCWLGAGFGAFPWERDQATAVMVLSNHGIMALDFKSKTWWIQASKAWHSNHQIVWAPRDRLRSWRTCQSQETCMQSPWKNLRWTGTFGSPGAAFVTSQ